MIPVMGLSLVSVECHGFYNKPIEIFKISGITLLGGPSYIQVRHAGADFLGHGAQKHQFKSQKPQINGSS